MNLMADGWTSGTTFVPNSGNGLASSTFNGVTTNYGYNSGGQLTSRTRGSYAASYGCGYGGLLTSVTSTFPGEGAFAYEYGGNNERRERTAGLALRYVFAPFVARVTAAEGLRVDPGGLQDPPPLQGPCSSAIRA